MAVAIAGSINIIKSWRTTEILMTASGLLMKRGRNGRITPATIRRNKNMQPKRDNATPGLARWNVSFVDFIVYYCWIKNLDRNL
jgi:hypothetical protein